MKSTFVKLGIAVTFFGLGAASAEMCMAAPPSGMTAANLANSATSNPSVTVTGTVRDTAGQTVGGAKVVLGSSMTRIGAGPRPPANLQTKGGVSGGGVPTSVTVTTGGDGSYSAGPVRSIDPRVGYTMTVSKDGCKPETRSVTASGGQDFQLVKLFTVRIHFENQNRVALQGVEVKLGNNVCYTDGSGYCTFTNIEMGCHPFTAKKADYRDYDYGGCWNIVADWNSPTNTANIQMRPL